MPQNPFCKIRKKKSGFISAKNEMRKSENGSRNDPLCYVIPFM